MTAQRPKRISPTGAIRPTTVDGQPSVEILEEQCMFCANCYTVCPATPRLLSIQSIRMFADLADKYCGGHLRFTSRNNVEFIMDTADNIEALKKDLQKEGFGVGGTGRSISSIVHTQGWVHCHSAATDASGVVKSVMDALYDQFANQKLPAKLRIALACCLNMCGAVHCSDISILGIHRKPPRILHDLVRKQCEIPNLIASCPTGAIRPTTVAPPAPSVPRRWTASPLWRSWKSSACSAPTATPFVRPRRSMTLKPMVFRFGSAER
jgi:dissimilatory sulfite reductase (desulfoviridin) alpha/beta subunit